MAKHNFETQIRNQLDGLAISPSPTVWQRIEGQLPNQARGWRRGGWLAIAAMFIVGALSVGSYYLLNNNANKKDIAKKVQEKSTLKSSLNNISKASTPKDDTKTDKASKTIAKVDNNTQSNQLSNKAIADVSVPPPNNTNNSIVTKKYVRQHNKKIYVASTNKNKINEYLAANRIKNELRKHPAKTENIAFIEPKVEKNSIAMDRPAITTADISNIKIVALNVQKVEPIIILPTIPSHKKQIVEWSVHMTNGVSWQAGKSNDIASTNIVNEGIAIYGNMSGGQPPVQKTAYAYSVGANISFPLSSRLAVGGGVSYLSLSTRTQLGPVVNAPAFVNQGNEGATTVYDYYQAGPTTNNYTTQQQSLQVPVFVEWKALDQKRFPVWVTAGVSVLKQISANDILYDPTTNISYKSDNTTMKNIQWQLNLGIKTTLWHKGPLKIQAGPYYEVGLGNIYKESLLQHGNWKMIGLKAQFNFGGK